MSITNKQKYCDSFTIPLKSKIAYHQNAQATKVHHTKKIFGEANVIINKSSNIDAKAQSRKNIEH